VDNKKEIMKKFIILEGDQKDVAVAARAITGRGEAFNAVATIRDGLPQILGYSGSHRNFPSDGIELREHNIRTAIDLALCRRFPPYRYVGTEVKSPDEALKVICEILRKEDPKCFTDSLMTKIESSKTKTSVFILTDFTREEVANLEGKKAFLKIVDEKFEVPDGSTEDFYVRKQDGRINLKVLGAELRKVQESFDATASV
jgi:hypothetical protein